MKKYFYLNGKILPLAKPSIQFNDLGLLRGYGVFDFMRTYNGKIFHWQDHWRRFIRSAKILDLTVPLSAAQTERVIKTVAKKNSCIGQDFSIRLVLTGGVTADGMHYQKPNFAVLLEDLYSYDPKLYQRGAKLIVFDYQRLLPDAKNNNYIHAVRLQKELKRQGASEILFVNQGKILECSTANFFLFKGDTLVTSQKNILGGITRKLVLSLARKKFKVEEREVLIDELTQATEAFATGTNKGVLPVVKVGKQTIGSGRVGENTKWLMEAYQQYIQKY